MMQGKVLREGLGILEEKSRKKGGGTERWNESRNVGGG